MTNTSSRILRKDELGRVSPVKWHEESLLSPRILPSRAVAESPALAAEREIEGEPAEREAYHKGFAEGKTVGRDQAAAELQVLIDRLTRSLGELSALRQRIRKEAESDLIKLAIAVARRVLHRELTLDPESIGGLIRVALEKLDARELCRVRVHPDQEEAVRSSLARSSGSQQVEVVPDPVLQCGDVLFETPQGALDASIETQLREIERGFADRLKR
jgi:flagellar assembly protein FliH